MCFSILIEILKFPQDFKISLWSGAQEARLESLDLVEPQLEKEWTDQVVSDIAIRQADVARVSLTSSLQQRFCQRFFSSLFCHFCFTVGTCLLYRCSFPTQAGNRQGVVFANLLFVDIGGHR